MIKLDSEAAISAFNSSLQEEKSVGILGQEAGIELYLDNGTEYLIDPKLLPLVNIPPEKYNKILYGKNGLEGIVGAEADGDQLILFIQKNGETITKIIPNRLWVCAGQNYDDAFKKLDGNRDFKFIRYYKDVEKWHEVRKLRYKMDLFASYCPIEANFIARGFTYFKGLEIKDVPVLSFDIETAGLDLTDKSDIYLISNTYRIRDREETKLFDFHDYPTRKAFLEAWCSWVREKNPAIMLGHNIYGYDLPYLKHVAALNDASLDLGRDGSSMTINSWPSKFRKDGTEKILFFKCNIWGRELVDTYFLSFKYDVGRKYESNGLKQIIKQEGLEKQGRTFVDAGKIRNYLNDKDMWPKICDYARQDAGDALALFDLMAPAFFYANQLIPKKFEDIMTGASGAQLNSMMLRSYLQENESIPRPSEAVDFQGAISLGIPGIYRNSWKVDAVQLYPSLLIGYGLFDEKKDPKNNLTYCLKEFMRNRRHYKQLFKETKNEQYDAMQNTFKIFSNSIYGFLGAPGLNFNSPKISAKITELGRETLEKAINWATSKNLDSFMSLEQIEESEDE